MADLTHYRGGRDPSPHAFIATPTYSGKLDARYVEALMNTMDVLREKGIGFEHFVYSRSCHVDDARNAITAKFLESECKELIFLDADVSWDPEALVKLIEHDRDLVAGVYPKRSFKDTNFPVLVAEGVALQADQDGLVEVLGAPTGFMKIKRHVLEKMQAKNADRTYMEKGSNKMPITIIFERSFVDNRRYSGDLNFCREWREMGGKVFVDPEMKLCHVGEVSFEGTLGDHWREKHGVAAQEKLRKFQKALDTIKYGEPTDETFNDLVTGWANPFSATSELLLTCYEIAKQSEGPILETGTGLTTIVMALANPKVKIHALEHDAAWSSATTYKLAQLGVDNVEVHYSPLKAYDGGDWYNIDSLPDESFDFVLCDGPPRKISNRSILYRELDERIKESILIMDDADNDEVTTPLREWAAKHGRDVMIMGSERYFALSPKKEMK